MIKYVEYSNLDLSKKNLPPYSKWIGSILQTIIDRKIHDAYVSFLFSFFLIFIRPEKPYEGRFTPKKMVSQSIILLDAIGLSCIIWENLLRLK